MKVLSSKNIGVVAHFYMDPQVQGVLTSASQRWPNIHISDSLVMADSAVRMAEAGCKAVAVLGVDFMSENVRAILDEAGHTVVKVGCLAYMLHSRIILLPFKTATGPQLDNCLCIQVSNTAANFIKSVPFPDCRHYSFSASNANGYCEDPQLQTSDIVFDCRYTACLQTA